MTTFSAARYATVTSTLALVVALGGTSYAAVKIGSEDLANNAVISSKIKNGAVTTPKLKSGAVTGSKITNDSVTGADVKEKTLGLVPNADTATYAADAGTVGGATVTTVNDIQGTGPGRPHFIYSSDGLDIEFRCNTTGDNAFVALIATSSRGGSRITTTEMSDEVGATLVESDVENGHFGPLYGDFNLLVGNDGDVAQATFTYSDPAGAVVQGTLATDVTASAAEPCTVAGFIVSR